MSGIHADRGDTSHRSDGEVLLMNTHSVGDTVFRIGSDGLNTPGVYGTVTDLWSDAPHGAVVTVRDDTGMIWQGEAHYWTVVEHSVRVGA